MLGPVRQFQCYEDRRLTMFFLEFAWFSDICKCTPWRRKWAVDLCTQGLHSLWLAFSSLNTLCECLSALLFGFGWILLFVFPAAPSVRVRGSVTLSTHYSPSVLVINKTLKPPCLVWFTLLWRIMGSHSFTSRKTDSVLWPFWCYSTSCFLLVSLSLWYLQKLM